MKGHFPLRLLLRMERKNQIRLKFGCQRPYDENFFRGEGVAHHTPRP